MALNGTDALNERYSDRNILNMIKMKNYSLRIPYPYEYGRFYQLKVSYLTKSGPENSKMITKILYDVIIKSYE